MAAGGSGDNFVMPVSYRCNKAPTMRGDDDCYRDFLRNRIISSDAKRLVAQNCRQCHQYRAGLTPPRSGNPLGLRASSQWGHDWRELVNLQCGFRFGGGGLLSGDLLSSLFASGAEAEHGGE
ncbi:MAG: hypothetical protein JWP89_4186 [Schlesneria sp.]|nr:hypothetical protein [Schlesneria sp.]